MIGCEPVLPAIHLMAQMAILQALPQVRATVIKVQVGEHYRITSVAALTGVTVSADSITTLVHKQAVRRPVAGKVCTAVDGIVEASSG